MRIQTITVLFIFLFLATALFAQSGGDASKAKQLKLKAGEIEFTEILAEVGEFLDRTYLFEPALVNGPRGQVAEEPSVVLPRPLILTEVTVEDVLSQLLFSKGYIVLTLDREKGIYNVLKERSSGSRGSRSARTVLPQVALSLRSRYELIRTVISVRHIDARQLVGQLRSMGNQSGSIIAVSTQQVMITDLAPMVANVIEILQAIDIPQVKAPVRVKSSQAVTLEQTVARLHLRLKALEAGLLDLNNLVNRLKDSESKIRAAYGQAPHTRAAKDQG